MSDLPNNVHNSVLVQKEPIELIARTDGGLDFILCNWLTSGVYCCMPATTMMMLILHSQTLTFLSKIVEIIVGEHGRRVIPAAKSILIVGVVSGGYTAVR